MNSRPWARMLTWGFLGLGVVLRLRAYLDGRPLWLDEAMLALSILSRPFHGLVQPLLYDQSAPVLFLWAERLAALTGGANEFVLRALPQLAGLLVLVIVWRLASRLLSQAAVPLAVGLAALSPTMIYYANEVKPYAVDALLSSVVVLATVAVLEAPGSARAWRWLWIVGTLALVASAPAFLVVSGVIPALLLRRAGPGEPDIRIRTVITGLAWALLFGAVYLTVYREIAHNGYMQTFWSGYFLDVPVSRLWTRVVGTVGDTLRDFFLGKGGSWRSVAALVLLLPAAAGAVRLWRTRGAARTALLTLPIIAAVGAATIRRYPIGPRLMLYSAPLWILLIVAGLEAVGEWLGLRRPAWMLATVGMALLALPARFDAAEFRHPSRPHDLRPLANRFRRAHAPGDAVYVFPRAVPSWVYYTSDWRHPDLDRVERMAALNGSAGEAFRNRKTRSGPVMAEGDSLVYPYQDWIELIGVPTGQGPSENNPGSDLPDVGWADNEARRIRAAGRATVWVILNSFRAPVPGLLMTAIEAKGGTLVEQHPTTNALLLRYHMVDSASLPNTSSRAGADSTR